MTKKPVSNIGASVRQRLLNLREKTFRKKPLISLSPADQSEITESECRAASRTARPTWPRGSRRSFAGVSE